MSAIKPTTTYFVITLILGVFGGAIAYMVLRKDYPKQAKQILLIGVVISVIWTAVFAAAGNDDSDDDKNRPLTELEKQSKIIQVVQNYNGTTRKGMSVAEAIAISVATTYPGEGILENPSTQHGWYAEREYQMGNDDIIYRVVFYFETYSEKTEFVWFVNTNTDKIYAGNEHGKAALDLIHETEEFAQEAEKLAKK